MKVLHWYGSHVEDRNDDHQGFRKHPSTSVSFGVLFERLTRTVPVREVDVTFQGAG